MVFLMEDAFENAPTSTLLAIRENLWNGLGKIGETVIAGTFNKSKNEKAAPPSQFGQLTLQLFLKANTILVNRGEEDWTARL